MKTKKLAKLIENAIAEEDTNFHYTVCPCFKDCSREVSIKCLRDYEIWIKCLYTSLITGVIVAMFYSGIRSKVRFITEVSDN